MNRILAANLAAALAAFSAGASVVATRMAVGELDPVAVAFLRYAIAAPCMLPSLFAGTSGARLNARDTAAIAALGCLFFGLFPWAFSAALEYTTAARGSIGLATMPIATLLIACAFGRERFSGVKSASTLLAFIGVVVAFLPAAWSGAVGPSVLFGDGLMMLAVLCGAVYSALARPYLMRYGPLFTMALAMQFGLLLLVPLTGLNSDWASLTDLTPMGWAAVIFLGTVGGAIQFALYTFALKWIAPSSTAIYLTLNPISAMALATIILDEAISWELVAGFILVSSGIILANRPERPAPKPTATPAKTKPSV